MEEGVIELWGLLLYTSGALFHVEWCIRQTALVFFYHIP